MNHLLSRRCVTVAVCLGAALSTSCTNSAPPEILSERWKTVTNADKIPGYVHATSASRFRLGGNPVVRNESGMTRLVGPEGAIATTSTGATIAVANADSPALRAPPLSHDEAVHNARVLRYFTEAGLPKDQVGQLQVTAVMMDNGPVDAAPQSTFVGYNTIIHRKVSGFLVAGSYAWARFNQDDDVVAEEVYFPELPASVVQDAAAIKARLDVPTEKEALFAKIPLDLVNEEHEVVIHHSGHYVQGFECYASLDFRTKTSSPERRFDVEGREVGLPPPAPVTPKPQ